MLGIAEKNLEHKPHHSGSQHDREVRDLFHELRWHRNAE
jgi:hypothetical protein